MTIFFYNVGNTRFQLLQGDIVLTEAQQALIETLSNQNNPNGPQHAVTKVTSSLWKEGIVPYIMDNGLSKYLSNTLLQKIANCFIIMLVTVMVPNATIITCIVCVLSVPVATLPVQTLTGLMSLCMPRFCENVAGKQNPLICYSLIWTHIA